MAATDHEWSSSANEALRISLVRPDKHGEELETVSEFSPAFTYPIFGESEMIFGYTGLDIHLQFAAHDGSPHVSISYDKKFPTVKKTSALDLNKTLKEHLPASAFTFTDDSFAEKLLNDNTARDWTPPGKLVHQYSKGGRNFEIWKGSRSDSRVNELLGNIQAFVLLYIEGGQLLDLAEAEDVLDKWEVYFVYEKVSSVSQTASPYSFVGYATVFRFWRYAADNKSGLLDNFPNFDDTIAARQLPSCPRIAQFLLLPPYQKSGHGSQLYGAISRDAVSDSTTCELAAEDTAEEFDLLRDLYDWKVLEPQFKQAKLSINADALLQTRRIHKVPTATLLPLDTLRALRKKNKIGKRQFARQVELYLLAQIPFSHRILGGANLTKLKIQKHMNKDLNDRIYYWWRILLKQRITRQHRDTLSQYDLEERREKVEDSARGQEDEYEGLLMMLAMRQVNAEGLMGDSTSEGSRSIETGSRKRKVIEEDDEDDEESVQELEVSISKKSRQ